MAEPWPTESTPNGLTTKKPQTPAEAETQYRAIRVALESPLQVIPVKFLPVIPPNP